MTDPYEELVSSDAISSKKRDILLEASADIYYLAHIRRWFAEKAGSEAAKVAPACTVRVINELIAKGLCSLARWGKEKGSFEVVEMTDQELTELVEKYKSFDVMPFDFFLIATEAGNRWVARYESLTAEL